MMKLKLAIAVNEKSEKIKDVFKFGVSNDNIPRLQDDSDRVYVIELDAIETEDELYNFNEIFSDYTIKRNRIPSELKLGVYKKCDNSDLKYGITDLLSYTGFIRYGIEYHTLSSRLIEAIDEIKTEMPDKIPSDLKCRMSIDDGKLEIALNGDDIEIYYYRKNGGEFSYDIYDGSIDGIEEIQNFLHTVN